MSCCRVLWRVWRVVDQLCYSCCHTKLIQCNRKWVRNLILLISQKTCSIELKTHGQACIHRIFPSSSVRYKSFILLFFFCLWFLWVEHADFKSLSYFFTIFETIVLEWLTFIFQNKWLKIIVFTDQTRSHNYTAISVFMKMAKFTHLLNMRISSVVRKFQIKISNEIAERCSYLAKRVFGWATVQLHYMATE